MARVVTVVFCFLLCATICHLSEFRYCEKSICAVIISKCLIMQECICRATDPHCCKTCGECLENLYVDCCGCLDLCANVCPENIGILPPERPLSRVANFDGIPDLFTVLTADADDPRWTRVDFSASAPNRTSLFGAKINPKKLSSGKQTHLNLIVNQQNCTVIFLNGCATRQKCFEVCESMGANGARWFYDGCCQCVGSQCIDYGIKENLCKYCPLHLDDDDEELDYVDQDLLEYGEED